MNTTRLSSQQAKQFHADGFLFIEQFLDAEETNLLLDAAVSDRTMQDRAFSPKDAEGRESKLSLWNHPGDDIYGVVARSHRLVDSMEHLLGGEVYHYHSKIMLKEPRVGGAWEWHQDYGYWYDNGCLYPDMASCMIALDPATRENGCLQVLKGSHHMGRIEHGRFGQQTGADPERVTAAMERMELLHCEMQPGTALFFHSNLLHRSDANDSPNPRWTLICCYNTARNDPYKDSHHPRYTPLEKVPDSAIKATGGSIESSTREFLKPEEDRTTGAGKR